MSPFSEAEQQVLIAIRHLGTQSKEAHCENLNALGPDYFRRSLVTWSGAYDQLLAKGLISREGDRFTLTDDGQHHAETLHTAYPPIWYFYIDFYNAAPYSQASATFCERVYGADFCQHGYADMAQLDRLVEVASLGPENYMLDLGCGTGQIVEYISDVTGARAHGIDYMPHAIRLAQERTVSKCHRLSFSVGDIGSLDLPSGLFDTVIAIDSFYFGDLVPLIATLKMLLKPGGQIVAYYMKILFDEADNPALVESENIPLTQALQAHELAFQLWDVTQIEYERARRAQQVAKDLKADFETEGNMFLYENRMMEANGNVRFIESGRARRYLYHVKL